LAKAVHLRRKKIFERYAIFYTPTGKLADFGAQWLGWDSAQGHAVSHSKIGSVDVPTVTQTPRKYGLHGTMKAPFHLAKGCDVAQSGDAASAFSAGQAAFEIGTLEPRYDSGFVALRPRSQEVAPQRLSKRLIRFAQP
jgi:hypothetical protein